MEHADYLYYWGDIFKVDTHQPLQQKLVVGFDGDDFRDLEVDASGKLYGTTGSCGGYKGTVWQLTP